MLCFEPVSGFPSRNSIRVNFITASSRISVKSQLPVITPSLLMSPSLPKALAYNPNIRISLLLSSSIIIFW